MKNNVQNLTFTALMTAMICIAGPIVIPIGMVPVSFVNMAIYFAIILLDKKKATISILVYLLIGFVGIPVFAGFTAGVGKLLGPTGGYLLGYPVLSWIAGTMLEHGKKSRIHQVFALVTGTLVLYLTGTFWLMFQSRLDFFASLWMGVIPFVIFDFGKILLAIWLGNSVKRRIKF